MTPTILNNRYRVLQVLAKGGFGETFLAEDSFLPSKRPCVIKQLKTMADNPQVYRIIQERFHREAAILEELGRSSSQIPELYAYFEESDRFYLVQEWVEGQTLANKVRQTGLFNESTAYQLLENILPVMGVIHSRGIIHRDIKPDNIILRQSDGKPVLIDFGAVKESVGTLLNSQGQTVSSIVIGTPGYMSPEQGAGRPVFSSDLYGLGLTVIYLFTGKLPQDLPTDHRTGDLLWRSFAPSISDALVAILDKMIQYHPRDRFATAQEVLSALHATTIASPIPPTQPIQHFPPPIPPTVPVSGSPIPPTAPVSIPPVVALPPSSLPDPVVSSPSPSSTSLPSSLPTPDPSLPSTKTSTPAQSSRTLLAAGITAAIVALLGGSGYIYVQQQARPYREAEAALEQIETLHLQGNHQECINRAQSFPRDFPELFEQVRMILTNCSAARDEETLQEAVNIASQPDANLVEAIEKAQQIKNSPVREDAEEFIFRWQASVLQEYLRVQVPQNQSERNAARFRRIQPTVTQFTGEEIAISYDTSKSQEDTALAGEEGIRLMTVTFMEQILNKNPDNAKYYDELSTLVVYPQQGNLQARLKAEQWAAYQDNTVNLDQLLSQIEVAAR